MNCQNVWNSIAATPFRSVCLHVIVCLHLKCGYKIRNSFTLIKCNFLFEIHSWTLGSKLIWLNRNWTSFINVFVASVVSSLVRLIRIYVESSFVWKINSLTTFPFVSNGDNNKKQKDMRHTQYSLWDHCKVHYFDFQL